MKTAMCGKGNRKAQNKRRRERKKFLPMKQDKQYQLIDNNLSYYPIAYCKAHEAWLSLGLMDTHKCIEKGCIHLEERQVEE